MPITLTQTQASLALWWAAYDAVSKGSTFSMNGRTLTRANADECWDQISRLSRLEKRQLHSASGRSGHTLAEFSD